MVMGLKYTDDSDKCYGVTGMAIGLVALDREELLESLSLDAEPGEAVKLTSEFYFSGNPRFSARHSWNHILQNFQLSTAMLIANMMCRCCVQRHGIINRELKNRMLTLVAEEGRSTCSLEDDEVNEIFEKSFDYFNQLFNHRGVQTIADDFANTLSHHRELSRGEVIEHLRALSML